MTNLSLRAFAAAGALTIGFGVSALAQPSQPPPRPRGSPARADPDLSHRDVALAAADGPSRGRRRTSASERPRAAYRTWVRDLWRTARRAAERRAAEPPHRAGVALHPPLRAQPGPGLGDAHGQRLLRRPADGHLVPAHLRPGAPRRRAPRTAGRRSSRCGSPSAPTAAAGASTRGRTPPAPAA